MSFRWRIFPMKLISLDWFELQKIIRSRGDIYNLSKHVKSRFLSSHRPSWHITRLQLQFKCPTKSIPIFNLNVPQNPLQWSSPISPKLRVPQKFPNFRFGFFIRHKFLNWNLNYSFPNSALFHPAASPQIDSISFCSICYHHHTSFLLSRDLRIRANCLRLKKHLNSTLEISGFLWVCWSCDMWTTCLPCLPQMRP